MLWISSYRISAAVLSEVLFLYPALEHVVADFLILGQFFFLQFCSSLIICVLWLTDVEEGFWHSGDSKWLREWSTRCSSSLQIIQTRSRKSTRSPSTLPTTFAYFKRRLVACPSLWKRLARPCRSRRCPSSFTNRSRAKTLAETAVLRRLTYSARPLTASKTVGTVKEVFSYTHDRTEPNRADPVRFATVHTTFCNRSQTEPNRVSVNAVIGYCEYIIIII